MHTTTATPDRVGTEWNPPVTETLATRSVPKASPEGELDLDVIVRRLLARTTDAQKADEVRRIVDEVAHEFDDARVRSFLPVLILKEAQDRLRALGLIRQLTV